MGRERDSDAALLWPTLSIHDASEVVAVDTEDKAGLFQASP